MSSRVPVVAPVPAALMKEREEQAAAAVKVSTRRLLYTGVALVAAVQVLAILAVQGVIRGLGASVVVAPWKPATAFLAAAVVLACVADVRRRWPWRATRRRPAPVAVRDFVVVAVGVVAGVALATLAFAAAFDGAASTMPLAALAVLVAVAPIGVLDTLRRSRVRRMEERFPDFLRDLIESQQAALTMNAALRMTARGEYGALTPEVRRMAKQLSWGVTFQEALLTFGERVGTPLVERTVRLIVRATESGGDVAEVLRAAARDAREIKTLENERRFTMTIYVLVIYVSFGVYLAVVAALQGVFVPAMLESTRGAGTGFGPVSIAPAIDATTYRDFFFASAFVQGLGSGGMAGLLAEGGVSAGLKHVAVLLGIALVVLGFLL